MTKKYSTYILNSKFKLNQCYEFIIINVHLKLVLIKPAVALWSARFMYSQGVPTEVAFYCDYDWFNFGCKINFTGWGRVG
jgi:hypothetical protein